MDELITRVASSRTFRQALQHDMRIEMAIEDAVLIVKIICDSSGLRVARGFCTYYNGGMIERTLFDAYTMLAKESADVLSARKKGTVSD